MAELRALVAPAEAIFLDAKIESELVELPDDEALELLQSIGQDEPGLDQLARVGFAHPRPADLPDRRARRRRAPGRSRSARPRPQAAGVIHTDFQRGFIKAEIVSYDELVTAGSMAEAKARGQGAHRGQGLRHARRRRRGVPLQRVSRGYFRRSEAARP